MWSIWVSSARDRSPTPEPASISTSLSTRNEVVRRWRPPIPPEQPSTRNRIAAGLLFVERRDAVPGRGRRIATTCDDPVGVKCIQLAAGSRLPQLGQAGLGLVPLLAAVGK